jgi:hypothetical protein
VQMCIDGSECAQGTSSQPDGTIPGFLTCQ